MKKLALYAPGLAVLLAGCVVGPDYKPPVAELPEKYSESAKRPVENVTLNPWWDAFRDKRLTALVDQGMQENLGVMGAVERIMAARANVVLAGAGAMPQADLSKSASVSGTKSTEGGKSPVTATLSTGVGASWLLDFFGEFKRAKEAANASLDAAYDDINIARLAYLADLTATYVDLRFAQESIALSRQNLESRRTTLKLINDIRDAGSASRLDVIQAEGLVNQTLADIPSLEVQFHSAANHIATLLGVPAATMTASLQRGGRQPMPRYTKIGVPADLIRNRPDIRKAERLLAVATANIGVSEAQLYPSISLGGAIDGTRSVTSKNSVGVLSWSFGPSLNLPLLDGNARKAQIDLARSGATQQYLAWKQTVLNAVEEVESAQIAVRRDYQTLSALDRLLATNNEALGLARESYKGGTATVLDVLDAERNVAGTRLTRAAAIRQLAINYITLNVAIGGGSDLGDTTKTTKVVSSN